MMWYRLLRSLVFALDPERAHRLVMAIMGAAERAAVSAGAFRRALTAPEMAQELWGIGFPNPVGLAAGFDKDARAPHAWSVLGFGFAELGTVTAEAQPGNPRPRIFRLASDRALINRLGFNNEGAATIAGRLGRASWRRPAIPIGINLGTSRATALADAPADYERSLRALFPFADYVVVNVSSPNTPGLRDLQAEDQLRTLLERLAQTNDALAEQHQTRSRPLLVKISPDLADDGIASTVMVARQCGAHGIVATNTTVARDGLRVASAETGGLSGVPLRARATAAVRIAYQAASGMLPIIGVGGIFTADDAYEKIRAGASLVQLYTGLIYEGPLLARHIVRGLQRRLQAEGIERLSDLVGRDVGIASSLRSSQ
jgi:dihydroorotate dehydrogenase